MYLFVNGFRISSKDNLREVAIDFLQNSPKYDENSRMIGSNTEVVASITMHGDIAARLKDGLAKVIAENSENEPSDVVD